MSAGEGRTVAELLDDSDGLAIVLEIKRPSVASPRIRQDFVTDGIGVNVTRPRSNSVTIGRNGRVQANV